MGLIETAQYLLALLIVLGLIGGLAWLARRYGPFPGMAGHPKGQPRRLKIIESLSLDPRRRLILVRRDQTDHLILLSHTRDVIVETGIKAPAPSAPVADEKDEYL